ncbi:hypothetical protein HC026_06630 [Lactobacillus sp. LC28-10]|uniref:Heme-degrading domain-containing protein n=1 Tax=Secundilactobacillus angelensis TaxID=2722706 RepID=A0ABX1KXB9_9LACO|nr:heme-binding protein [Secundilactobacillus angelensis]MCH5461760.1 heme-binding protein [Secundilactobacillus angelensis]NLR18599.1 hypothetical protein [Secundilactobacillus angelensis]
MLSAEEILNQETETTLPHFGLSDLNDFVDCLQKVGKDDYEKVCVLIKLNKRPVFFHAGKFTTNENNIWISKKEKAVDLFDHSSLYEKAINLNNESEFFTSSGLSPKDVAIVGGGLPIFVADTGIVGSLIISGLTDEGDHNLGYQTLVTFKKSLQ